MKSLRIVPSTLACLLATLSLASASAQVAEEDACPTSAARAAQAAQPDPAVVVDPVPSAVPSLEEPPREQPESNPRVKLHAVGFAFHATTFAAQNHYGYTLMGPSVTYTYFVGRRWGFALRGEMYFPLSSRYAGPEADFRTALREPYASRRLGLDGLLLVARRLPLTPTLTLLVGGGVHVQSFKLNGTQYAPLEGITGGVGGLARLSWHATRLLVVGGELAVGVDPIDFVRHANRAVITVPFSLSLSVGLTY